MCFVCERSDSRVDEAWLMSELLALQEHNATPVICFEDCHNGLISVRRDDQCYRCGGGIAPAKRHLLIEIAVHTSIEVEMGNVG